MYMYMYCILAVLLSDKYVHFSCVICMSDFESNELLKTLNPCKHDFHSKCIDPWLKVSIQYNMYICILV